MMTTAMAAAINDADLVNESLAGNHEAFGQIVARYQSLVCSLAYSATGSLSRSEDLAQETFVTAWRQLRDLREPEKLRSWLCRIARNLTYLSTCRKQGSNIWEAVQQTVLGRPFIPTCPPAGP
jgi:DNA-directed RNA polymerase specialized sigma24 family protein